jgi:dolichol-phosphate mannosyltransferase
VVEIIIPTYNEAQNIAGIIVRVRELLPDARILVVDDNSPDGTSAIVKEIALKDPNVRLLARAGKEGLGKAYLHGFREVLENPDVTHLIMMDADFSHDPEYLPQLLDRTKTHELVIGSRYIPGGGTEGWEGWRRYLSSGGNFYCRIITGMPINDMTAGFNVISTGALRRIDFDRLDSSGYAFQIELKYLLWRAGVVPLEIPILFRNRREGESKISNHIIVEGLIAPWKLKLRNR